MLPALLVILPAALALPALFVARARFALGVLLATAVLHAAMTLGLWIGPPSSGLAPYLEVDPLGLLFLSVTSALFLAVAFYAVPYLLHGTHETQAGPHRFVPCLLWFLSAMTLVAVTRHLAVMWVAVEATTLASAPLVYFYRRRGALEAAWKYLLICSVGIALALLGVFFLGIAASAVPGGPSALTVDALREAAPAMARPWLQAAFVLALVGYGTKMGLAPLHTWLPDTHSEAPSPVSALLSGALLNCAFLAILRFFQVCAASGDAAFARRLLILLGLVSIAVACAFIVGQRDYKRLFAYSSIENMGIVAVGAGLGGAAAFGTLLHVLAHSLCKAGLFCLAGNLLRDYGTTRAADVRGVLRRLPLTGALLLALFLALGGLPPFAPFWSEILILRAALDGAHPWVGVALAVLLAIAFLGMAGVLLPMIQGAEERRGRAPEAPLTIATPLALAAAALAIGVWLPPALREALRRAAENLG